MVGVAPVFDEMSVRTGSEIDKQRAVINRQSGKIHNMANTISCCFATVFGVWPPSPLDRSPLSFPKQILIKAMLIGFGSIPFGTLWLQSFSVQ